MQQILFIAIFVLSLTAVLYMLFCLKKDPYGIKHRAQLAAIAIIAFIADVAGIGSFAVTIAFCKARDLVAIEELPGLVNGAQIIPGAIEAFAFLIMIHVDPLTLGTLIAGTCLGGILGGMVVSRFNPKHTLLGMGLVYTFMAALILCHQLHIFPIGANETLLRGSKLLIGFFGTVVCGFLPALGAGLFAPVEVLLFLLGLSPAIAFPIMTAAGALQQPLTTMTFNFNQKIPIKKALWMGLWGVLGACATIPLVIHLSSEKLHWVLLAVLCFNGFLMLKSYFKKNL